MSTISTLSSTYWQSLLGLDSQTTNSSTANSCSKSTVSSSSSSSDSSTSDDVQLSPFAVELLGTLQQLQQSNPTEYKSAMSQISTNLEDASKSATADGNATAANDLSQLATDFTSASQSGNLPNIQDLLQAIGNSGGVSSSGYAPPPPQFFTSDVSASSGADSNSGATTSSANSTTTSGLANTVDDVTAEILASLQAGSNLSSSLNPMNIIMETLSSTGAVGSNS